MKLLICADAVAPTGFARVTHSICDYLKEDWEISILGVNHSGDPHKYDYDIYPAGASGDILGLFRFKKVIERVQPDLIWIINDPWIVALYLDQGFTYETPHVAYMPVDALNLHQRYSLRLNDLRRAIFYTEFGYEQAKNAGFEGKRVIIPHGVDLTRFYHVPQKEARDNLLMDDQHLGKDAYIVGNVNRNQPRKRMDLTVRYFSKWVNQHELPENVYLYLHCRPQDEGWDIQQLAHYYGVYHRLIMPDFGDTYSCSAEELNLVYNSLDVQVTTTQGEGWGLTHMEGMACKTPQVVPNFGALAEWGKGAMCFVPVSSYMCVPGQIRFIEGIAPFNINTIGAEVHEDSFVETLHKLYLNKQLRKKLGAAGNRRARQKQFRWESVAKQFDKVFREVLREHAEDPSRISEFNSDNEAAGEAQQRAEAVAS
jgi:glycosyltransferase involved in cell wall biosynthesis